MHTPHNYPDAVCHELMFASEEPVARFFRAVVGETVCVVTSSFNYLLVKGLHAFFLVQRHQQYSVFCFLCGLLFYQSALYIPP